MIEERKLTNSLEVKKKEYLHSSVMLTSYSIDTYQKIFIADYCRSEPYNARDRYIDGASSYRKSIWPKRESSP